MLHNIHPDDNSPIRMPKSRDISQNRAPPRQPTWPPSWPSVAEARPLWALWFRPSNQILTKLDQMCFNFVNGDMQTSFKKAFSPISDVGLDLIHSHDFCIANRVGILKMSLMSEETWAMIWKMYVMAMTLSTQCTIPNSKWKSTCFSYSQSLCLSRLGWSEPATNPIVAIPNKGKNIQHKI